MTRKGNPFNIIDGVVSQFHEMDAIVNNAINSTVEITRSLVDSDPDVTEDQLSKMKKTMLGYVELQNNINNFQSAYNNIKTQALAMDEMPDDLDAMLTASYNEANRDAAATSVTSPAYEGLLQIITDGLNDEAVPTSQPIVTTIDEFVMIEHGTTIPLDPISRLPVNDPVFNTVCKHVYDRANILQYIMSRGTNAKCPMLGCGNRGNLTPALLQDHENIKRLISRQKHDRARL